MNKPTAISAQRNSRKVWQFLAFLVLGVLVSGPVLADGGNNRNNNNYNNGRGDRELDNKNQKHWKKDNHSRGHGREHFDDRHRQSARDYFNDRKRRGHYREEPARRYRVGYQLPRDVIFYEVPRSVARVFDQPPRGYRYVRVSNDILLISVVTGLVIDALQN